MADKDLTRSLRAALDHQARRKPKPKVSPATGPKVRKQKGRGKKPAPRSRKPQREQMSPAEQQKVDFLVTPEAQRHNTYREVDFKLTEVVEGGKVKAKTARVIRNVTNTPVERWYARGKLDERQMAAILFYQEAWRAYLEEPRVTANYSPVIVRNAKTSIELWASSRLRAKEGLRLLDQEVFFREPVDHFQVWQNVVIWDEPAGVAGSRVGFCHKPAEAVAQVIVAGLAHKIADVVIDSSRKDFGDLLLDLDAPRRPGRRAT